MIKVVFVCWGNICRSPMAERVARAWLDEAGITGVAVSSAATSREEVGSGIDRRAARILQASGYDAAGHCAHQITKAEIAEADLLVAMEDVHVDRMATISGHDNPNVVLLSSFDPTALPGAGVPDPWYGGQDGFTETLEMIERAMPGFLDWARSQR